MARFARALTALLPTLIACASSAPAPEAANAARPEPVVTTAQPAPAPTTSVEPAASAPAPAAVVVEPRPIPPDSPAGVCPWPAQARDVDEGFVILRVEVLADGSAGSAVVLDQTSGAFGETARECTLQHGKFEPARDATGKAVPKVITVRMRFKRSPQSSPP